MSIVGDWDVSIKTPIGTLRILYSFTEQAGAISGVATGRHETVPLRDIVVSAGGAVPQVSWRQTITKPMRLDLEFEVAVEGDRLTGHSRAGRLPRSAVAGVRRT